ncbi:MAG: precorrin-2 C(20)-methyltransferase [Nitrospirae bacterium]|nr:precorrin-2 C(20)-methyltransferase [Nitrospirota bacterium]
MIEVGPTGVLFGVGIGPGDPELVTLKAVRVIQRSATVVTPKSVGKPSLARQVIESWVDQEKQELLEVGFPMQNGREHRMQSREETGQQIIQRLREGKDVACVTVGDPLLYSTFIHLFRHVTEALPHIAVEVIPGVTSITACAAAAQIPLACEDERVAVLSATADLSDLDMMLDRFDSVVVLKVGAALERVAAVLEKRGLRDRAVLVEWCGTPQQRIMTRVEDWGGASLSYFSTLIVRKP